MKNKHNHKKLKEQYKANKEAKVGDKCICPSCDTEFEKGNYQQAFCRTKRKTWCKDKYWNTVIFKKRNNTTRISPASARFTAQRDLGRFGDGYGDKDIGDLAEDSMHPFDPYSLGQE